MTSVIAESVEHHPQVSAEDAMDDLRAFIRLAQESGEFCAVGNADPELEIGAIYEMSQERTYPPVLLFHDIKGYSDKFRILCNVRNPRFVVGDLNIESLKAYRRRPKTGRSAIPPLGVETGPVFENVLTGDDLDVRRFPAPRWHAGDGGQYIGTECLVIVKDPDSDWVNIGTYRVMVHDRDTLGVFIEPGKHGDVIRRKYWARGEPCPMAICVGQAPVLGAMASTAVKQGVSEYAAAGGQVGRPIKTVRARKTGIPIPADAELVFDGYMPAPEVETRPEGPFGEWPGYYASDGPQPIFRVEAIYHRHDAIIVGQPPTKPNYPGRQVKIPSLAALWDALEAAGVPEIRGVWNIAGGAYRFIQVVSIKQLFAGHAKMAGMVAAGWGGSYMTRLTVIVDEDIDITVPAEVMWAIATRWDPRSQTDIIDGCWTGLIDPRLPPEKRESGDTTMSRAIIYAVRPFDWKDEFPSVNAVDRDYSEAIREKWSDRLPFLRRDEI